MFEVKFFLFLSKTSRVFLYLAIWLSISLLRATINQHESKSRLQHQIVGKNSWPALFHGEGLSRGYESEAMKNLLLPHFLSRVSTYVFRAKWMRIVPRRPFVFKLQCCNQRQD